VTSKWADICSAGAFPAGQERIPLSAQKAMKEYESRCPLLSFDALKRLKQRGEQREGQISGQIERAATSVRERRKERDRTTDERERETLETQLSQELRVVRRNIVEVAENAAAEGVREFADGLLLSQGRLGVHAVLVREYTAGLAGEIRDRLNTSELFQVEPLLPWRQDPIAQNAIQTCEEVLAERRKIEDPSPSDAEERPGMRTWPSLVQEWEALKSLKKLITGEYERIPESDLRNIIAAEYGNKAEDVTWEEIKRAASELCLHYGSFQMIPSVSADHIPADDQSRELMSKAGAEFWKEREDEFSRHDTPENTMLLAMCSQMGRWDFRGGPGADYSSRESRQLFQSLAREAAKGLAGSCSAEPWVDWLDALGRARDKSTGELMYATVSTGSTGIGERELERMAKSGEPPPQGGLIEFFLITSDQSTDSSEPLAIPADNLKVGTRRFWDTTVTTIERLFKTSAKYCLELRSLTPHRAEEVIKSTEQPPAQHAGAAARLASVNLTDQQKDLLCVLVSMHESSGGAQFNFVRSLTSSGLCYPGDISMPVANDETDFQRLVRENLIDFSCTSPNVYRGKPTQLGITIVRRGFALFDAESPPKEGVAPAAREPVVAKSDLRTDRPSLVDDFLHRCNEESTVGFKVIRKHIWLAVGHAYPRQFQYWQEGSDKATDEDDRNFCRILSMSPAEFLSLLKKKGISPSSS
jgi:hypothetical protein